MAGYVEIAAHFRRKIETGELQPGDRLPTVRDVMAEFEVAQQTASRAYRLLKQEGLTRAASGGGTVVTEAVSNNIGARVRSWAHTGRALSANETSQILAVETVGVDETIASRLEVEPGTLVHARRRLVSRDGTPVHLSTSYYPAYVISAVPELSEPVSTGGSRELAAERLGSAQDHVIEEVTSRKATDSERDALGLTSSAIVTQVLRTVLLVDGRVVEVAVKVTNGNRVLRWTTPLR